MKVVKNNYVNCGNYFEKKLELTCGRCESIFIVESATDILRRECEGTYEYYVRCPCCQRCDMNMKNLPAVVIDVVNDNYG